MGCCRVGHSELLKGFVLGDYGFFVEVCWNDIVVVFVVALFLFRLGL